MIRLSGLFSYEAIPLVSAVKRISSVQFEWLTFNALCDSFVRGDVDGILCPPLMALQFPESLIVPGVGVATSGGVPSPVLFSKKLISDIETVFISDPYRYWEDWLNIVWNLLHSNLIEKSLRINKERNGNEDAYLVDVIKESESNEGMYVYNLGEIWKQVTAYPMVCWVWLCRGDADYRQVRSVLGYIWDYAKENLAEFKWGNFKNEDIPEKWENQANYISDIYYNLASMEFDGIHWLVEQAKKYGIASEDAEIHIC